MVLSNAENSENAEYAEIQPSISEMAQAALALTLGSVSLRACLRDGNASALAISPSASAAPRRTSTRASDSNTPQSALTARSSFISLNAQTATSRTRQFSSESVATSRVTARSSRTSPNARAAAMRTHASESASNVMSCGTAPDLSPGTMFVNSPIAQAAFRRTVAFAWVSCWESGSKAVRPKEASASAASSPGDGCLNVCNAGPQLPVSQHLIGCVLLSSPSIAMSEGIAAVSPFLPAWQADIARSSADGEFD